ncbi:unnamed protein product [Sphenostylis stenocarpa]|uniref:Uncharacterized protein n=1 Tax=Sphenostylis stenocarpa TaxID=92480 RepID=A0AA86SUQ8_9FABA|nr:unnamed protein product [Sphenostylis stenocarpa]
MVASFLTNLARQPKNALKKDENEDEINHGSSICIQMLAHSQRIKLRMMEHALTASLLSDKHATSLYAV